MTSPVLRFADTHTVADFRTFTARARANDDGGMRLMSSGPVLAAYVRTLGPTVLGEPIPTVLGLRTMALGGRATVDATVPLGSVLDRLARMHGDDVEFSVPTVTVTENWAGVLPPRAGWTPAGSVPCAVLEQAARDGIGDVARALPDRAGAPLVSSVRAEVWGRQLASVPGSVPAGAAFGAYSLGFLDPDGDASIHENGRWSRISTVRGHILVRAAAVL
ncbi:hypothetical protein D6T63_04155 [Arthrobacter cheniae]|uniref:Uncharacterized protein n=1 Tax=Arthrobacter cheniae TaxID=1258888 RepID=A0A3A5M6X8_9MICC|nr:hypothetical protein [Arthrobacter cheniae]RJT81947.1 hypothetical protein D6T63_04155 [Arthrobacter cheniae]